MPFLEGVRGDAFRLFPSVRFGRARQSAVYGLRQGMKRKKTVCVIRIGQEQEETGNLLIFSEGKLPASTKFKNTVSLDCPARFLRQRGRKERVEVGERGSRPFFGGGIPS